MLFPGVCNGTLPTWIGVSALGSPEPADEALVRCGLECRKVANFILTTWLHRHYFPRLCTVTFLLYIMNKTFSTIPCMDHTVGKSPVKGCKGNLGSRRVAVMPSAMSPHVHWAATRASSGHPSLSGSSTLQMACSFPGHFQF
jgi:hypothetical protein